MGIAVVPLVAEAQAPCSAFTPARVRHVRAVFGRGDVLWEAATCLRPNSQLAGYAAAIRDALEGLEVAAVCRDSRCMAEVGACVGGPRRGTEGTLLQPLSAVILLRRTPARTIRGERDVRNRCNLVI